MSTIEPTIAVNAGSALSAFPDRNIAPTSRIESEHAEPADLALAPRLRVMPSHHPAVRGYEMSAKKAAGWGGSRRGAGRPKGSGKGPSANARINRVAVMLTDKELAKLERVALRKNVPVATLAYDLMAGGLRRVR